MNDLASCQRMLRLPRRWRIACLTLGAASGHATKPASRIAQASARRRSRSRRGRTGPRPRGCSSTARTRARRSCRWSGSRRLLQPNGQPFARRQPEPLRLPAQPVQPHPRPAGRLHRQRLRRAHHGRHDLRRLPHAPDHLGRHRVPDRRRPGDRRLPELPCRPRHRRRHGAEQRRGVHGLCRLPCSARRRRRHSRQR